jgi:hypothetical protein
VNAIPSYPIKKRADSVVRSPDLQNITAIMRSQPVTQQGAILDYQTLSVEKLGYLFTKVSITSF